MANETTLTSANDVTFAAWVEERIVQEARPFLVAKPLLGYYSLAGKPSKAMGIPRFGSFAAAGLTEGTAASNTQITTDTVTATTAEAGAKVILTDLLAESDVFAGVEPYIALMSRALAAKIDSDCCALASNLSVVESATGADLTMANITSAQYTLSAASAPGPLVCVLHPIQVRDLRNELRVTAATIFSTPQVGAAFMVGAPQREQSGFVGEYLGIRFYETSQIPAATNDKAGMMFSAGQGGMGAFVEKWGARVETRREPDMRGVMVVVTSAYAAVEVADDYGVKILSDGAT